MTRLGIEMPKSELAYSVEEAEKIAAGLGYPVVIRPAYTMGGTGGGLVYNVEELRTVANAASRPLSSDSSSSRRRSSAGRTRAGGRSRFEESEDHRLLHREHRRDGVHTGDSFCSAPC